MRVEEAAVTTHAMRRASLPRATHVYRPSLGRHAADPVVTVPFDVRDPLEGAAQAYDVIVDHLFEKHPVDLEPLVLARDWEAFHAVADITRNTFDYEQLLRDTTMGEGASHLQHRQTMYSSPSHLTPLTPPHMCCAETHLAACRPEIDTDGPVPWVGASFYISVRLRSRGANNMPLYGAIAMTYYKARGEEEGEWLEDEGEWFVRFVNGSGTVIAA